MQLDIIPCGFIEKEDLDVLEISSNVNDEYEEDLDGLSPEGKEKLAESVIGAYRAESTDLNTAGRGITTKIPPLFDGSTFQFKVRGRLVGSYSA